MEVPEYLVLNGDTYEVLRPDLLEEERRSGRLKELLILDIQSRAILAGHIYASSGLSEAYYRILRSEFLELYAKTLRFAGLDSRLFFDTVAHYPWRVFLEGVRSFIYLEAIFIKHQLMNVIEAPFLPWRIIQMLWDVIADRKDLNLTTEWRLRKSSNEPT